MCNENSRDKEVSNNKAAQQPQPQQRQSTHQNTTEEFEREELFHVAHAIAKITLPNERAHTIAIVEAAAAEAQAIAVAQSGSRLFSCIRIEWVREKHPPL